MRNDEKRHQLAEVMGLVHEQLADIAAVRKKQEGLTAAGKAADGMVEVTVNVHGHLVKTVIDESYLDEHEFAELAEHITEAARAAARDVAQRVADMMVPIGERRNRLPSLSEIVDGAPDLRDLVASLQGGRPPEQRRVHVDDGSEERAFPKLRR